MGTGDANEVITKADIIQMNGMIARNAVIFNSQRLIYNRLETYAPIYICDLYSVMSCDENGSC